MDEDKNNREQAFDRKSIKINPSETERFYKEKDENNKEAGSNPMFIALDEKGRKVLLKTSTYFKKDGTKNREGQVGLQYLQEMLDHYGDTTPLEESVKERWEDIYSEVQASHLCEYLGIPMVDTDIVEVDGVPYVAYQYLEDARDAGFGTNLEIDKDDEKRSKQSLILALTALVKVWFQAGDDGQFLIDKKENLYLSDLGYRIVGSLESIPNLQSFLSRQFVQGNEAMLANQLLGTKHPEFEEALQKIREIDEEKLRELICYDKDNPTENEEYKIKMLLENRIILLRVFKSIQQDPRKFADSLV